MAPQSPPQPVVLRGERGQGPQRKPPSYTRAEPARAPAIAKELPPRNSLPRAAAIPHCHAKGQQDSGEEFFDAVEHQPRTLPPPQDDTRRKQATSTKGKHMFNASYSTALTAFEAEHWATAAGAVEEALAIVPGSTKARALRYRIQGASILTSDDISNAAEECLLAAIAAYPKEPEHRATLGAFYMKQDESKFRAGAAEFQKGRELSSNIEDWRRIDQKALRLGNWSSRLKVNLHRDDYGDIWTPYRLHYIGEIKNGMPHGQGAFFNEDGEKLSEGTFKDGYLEGHGIRYWEDGAVYEGQFLYGWRHGPGTTKFPNGDVFVGEFKENKRHGLGKQTQADGTLAYSGQFEDDRPHGKGYGSKFLSDGAAYTGKLLDYEPHGKGTYTRPDGQKYVGFFQHGQFHGYGTIFSSNGKKQYEGMFKDDLRDGKGTAWRDDGTICRGTFQANKANGRGRITFADNCEYRGSLVAGQMHGEGSIFREGREVYRGAMAHGKREGVGTSFWENGKPCYKGEWVEGLASGAGTRFSQSSEKTSKYEGTFLRGEPHGQGTSWLKDGEKYTGGFKEGMRHGAGVVTSPLGKRSSGTWINGIKQPGFWKSVFSSSSGGYASGSGTSTYNAGLVNNARNQYYSNTGVYQAYGGNSSVLSSYNNAQYYNTGC